MIGHRCSTCRREKYVGRRLRRRPRSVVLNLVTRWVAANCKPEDWFFAEQAAADLRLRVHQVRHALHTLNLQGVVSQAKHAARNGFGWDADWEADRYQRLVREVP